MVSGPVPGSRVVADILRWRAEHSGSRRAFTPFLIDGEEEGPHLTYAELHRRAQSIAALLQTEVDPGARALFMYPPG